MKRSNEIRQQYWFEMLDLLERLDIPREFDKRCSVTEKGGRPYLYSPKEINQRMFSYFRRAVECNQPFTITALCLSVGISRRQFFNLQESSKEEFLPTIKKGRGIVEMYLETELLNNSYPKGAIFMLKVMGWE